jgi:hypothetical protein
MLSYVIIEFEHKMYAEINFCVYATFTYKNKMSPKYLASISWKGLERDLYLC